MVSENISSRMQRVTYAQFPMVTANKQWPTVRPFVRAIWSWIYSNQTYVESFNQSTGVFFVAKLIENLYEIAFPREFEIKVIFFFFTLPDTKIITIVKFVLNSRCDWQDKNYEKLPNVLYTTNDIILTNCTILVVFRYLRYELKIRYLFPDNYKSLYYQLNIFL